MRHRARRSDRLPAVVVFTGCSGSGKTTLITLLIPELQRRGVHVAAIKHASHGFSMDQPGKDSWRMAEAGAQEVAVVGAGRVAFLGDLEGLHPDSDEPDPRSLAPLLFPRADLVLAEGFSRSSAPCVEVRGPADAPRRAGLGRLLAVVTASGPGDGTPGAPSFGPEEAGPLAEFLLESVGLRPRSAASAPGDLRPSPAGAR